MKAVVHLHTAILWRIWWLRAGSMAFSIIGGSLNARISPPGIAV
jgi:hypothetical protein